ncbi:MAG: hypothetical protein WBI17_07140 [Clostridiaceae bacterium]
MSFKVNIDYSKLNKALDSISGNVSFVDLFTTQFMKEHTDFNTFEELLEFGGYEVNSPEDFQAIPDDEFDALICAKTKFQDWKTMQIEASKEYAVRTFNNALR